jgi:hypothetical protein
MVIHEAPFDEYATVVEANIPMGLGILCYVDE